MIWVVLVAGLLAACGNNRIPANLQEKLDSVHALEKAEMLRAQGIKVEEVSPMREFYDSLAIEPLPLSSSETYVAILPNYTPIPQLLAELMNFEGRVSPSAVALPETSSVRLMLLAADAQDGQHSLWLYTLDSDCLPVDKLCVYRPERMLPDGRIQTMEFSITSDYEICVTTYTTDHRQEEQRLYVIDESLHFVEWQ